MLTLILTLALLASCSLLVASITGIGVTVRRRALITFAATSGVLTILFILMFALSE